MLLSCSVQIISLLDIGQSKFQMLKLFSGRHALLDSVNFCEHFDQYLKFGKTHRLKTGKRVLSLYFL